MSACSNHIASSFFKFSFFRDGPALFPLHRPGHLPLLFTPHIFLKTITKRGLLHILTCPLLAPRLRSFPFFLFPRSLECVYFSFGFSHEPEFRGTRLLIPHVSSTNPILRGTSCGCTLTRSSTSRPKRGPCSSLTPSPLISMKRHSVSFSR